MSENNGNILIAHVTQVRSNGMEARITEQYATQLPLLTLGNDDILAGMIGSYVIIRQAEIKLLALVSKIWSKAIF